MVTKYSAIILSLCFLISISCSHPTAVKEQEQKVAAQFSLPLHLTPMNENQKTVYVLVRNHSQDHTFRLTSAIKQEVKAKGYHVTTVPDKAHYMIEAEVLGLSSDQAQPFDHELAKGYGKAVEAHALTFFDQNSKYRWFSARKNYQVLVDLRVSELSKEAVLETPKGKAKEEAASNAIRAYFNNVSHWTHYQTRLLLTMKDSNQDYASIKDELEQKLAEHLVSVFSS